MASAIKGNLSAHCSMDILPIAIFVTFTPKQVCEKMVRFQLLLVDRRFNISHKVDSRLKIPFVSFVLPDVKIFFKILFDFCLITSVCACICKLHILNGTWGEFCLSYHIPLWQYTLTRSQCSSFEQKGGQRIVLKGNY